MKVRKAGQKFTEQKNNRRTIENFDEECATRIATFNAVMKKEELDARELKGAAKNKALKDFRSGDGWLRGRDVDRLSEEEAGIMAGRLIRKIRTLIALTDEKARVIQEQSTDVIKRAYTDGVLVVIDDIAARLAPDDPQSARVKTLSVFALMVGTLQLSRALADRELADAVLEQGIQNALALLLDAEHQN